jgi:hypothetical protein
MSWILAGRGKRTVFTPDETVWSISQAAFTDMLSPVS